MVNRIEDVTKDEAEKLELIEKTRDIFFRACTYHLPSKVDIHLAWSAFEERYKNFDKAIEILNSIEKHHPKLMSLTNRKINAQRRCGNLTAVHAIYKDFIDGAKSASHRSDWSVKYSRFLRLQCADETKAVKVLEDFGSSISDLLLARSELSKLLNELKPQLKESETSQSASNAVKNADSRHSNGAATTTSSTSSTTTYPASNSSSYSAHHNNAYQQYGARYGYQYPTNYYSGYNY